VLWDAHSIPVHNHLRQLRELEKEIRYCHKRHHIFWIKHLKAIKHKMMADYENLMDRIWNDQKTGTYFPKGELFQPHQVTKVSNLVQWNALTRYTEMIAGETAKGFYFKKMGIGTTPATYNDDGLENEIATVDMREDGDINSDGNVLKDFGSFPPGVPSNLISEFCATDEDAPGAVVEYRTVIDRVEDRMGHIQDVTEVQEAHSIVFQAVTNIT